MRFLTALFGGLLIALACWQAVAVAVAADAKVFRAGAAAVDITPSEFPVVVNGMFNERTASRAHDALHSRALVLDDGATRLAIVVVDNLMIPRELIDEAKELAHKSTGIPVERMLVSATHTHSAPSVMGCLGSGVDPNYPRFLMRQIARSIDQAAANLAPARVGWAVASAAEQTHCRRWIRRSDRLLGDPFGQATVRANMHPGYQNPDAIGPAGPADPDLSLLSVQTPEGRPVAVLGNFAMHYYGSPLLSADVCGRFGDKLAPLLAGDSSRSDAPPFVGILSQGTSGDGMWMDYGQPRNDPGLEAYAEALAKIAHAACRRIEHRDWAPLAMREARLTLRRRTPDEERLEWARGVLAGLKTPQPQSMQEIYAHEAVLLHEDPHRELKLQALRIGELGITAIPNEVYALTGLKLKAQSPLVPTFNIELANGAEGYIPPPEQHKLGGYTTWPARTAGLEVDAEPRIVETLLTLLEEVSGRPRRTPAATLDDPYARAVLASKPLAYWRLEEMSGRQAADSAGRHGAELEDGIALFLPGPPLSASRAPRGNRCMHLAGGRITAGLPDLGPAYSVELWFWNGLPADARGVTAYLFSRGAPGVQGGPGDHLGIGGTAASAGKLIFFNGNQQNQLLAGKKELAPKTWHHVVLVRDGPQVRVYLDGDAQSELTGQAQATYAAAAPLYFGGRSDGLFPLEGKIDEIAVYNRVLAAEEIAAHWRAAGGGR